MSQLLLGNSFELMKSISSESIDFIFTDPNYNTTQNEWDTDIPLDQMWEQFTRIIKPNGCIAMWAQSPFDKILACSNLKLYRYEWIIEKTRGTGHLNCNLMPIKAHENVLIFYKHLPVYHPQHTEGHAPVHSYTKRGADGSNYGATKPGISGGGNTTRYPRDVLRFSWDTRKSKLHPTQKPVAACEYFIRTYTNPGEVVLDPFMGSGTIGVACQNLGREFIGIELEQKYYEAAKQRIERERKQ